MPSFAGVNHVALTVTDLDVSERFYTEVLGFRRVLDLGYGRLCMHQRPVRPDPAAAPGRGRWRFSATPGWTTSARCSGP